MLAPLHQLQKSRDLLLRFRRNIFLPPLSVHRDHAHRVNYVFYWAAKHLNDCTGKAHHALCKAYRWKIHGDLCTVKMSFRFRRSPDAHTMAKWRAVKSVVHFWEGLAALHCVVWIIKSRHASKKKWDNEQVFSHYH